MISGCGESARSSWLFKLVWPGPGGAFRAASVTKGRRHLRPQFGEAVGGGLRSLGAEAPVRVRRSAVHGYGLYAARELEAGTFVVEYRGQVIRTVLEDVREQACAPRAPPPSASPAPPHFLPARASRPPAHPAPPRPPPPTTTIWLCLAAAPAPPRPCATFRCTNKVYALTGQIVG